MSVDPDDILFPSEGIFETQVSSDDDEKAAQIALETLMGAYRRLFTGQGSAVDADKVVKDLYHVCWGAQTTFDPDPRVHALREGSRHVLLHILKYAGRASDGKRKDI